MTGAMAFVVASAAKELNDDTVSPGLLGLAVVAALGVATWLLIRSMNRQLRKIDFDEGGPARNPADRPADPAGQADPAHHVHQADQATQATAEPRDPPGAS
jgi:hypothetical protein